VRYAIKNWSQFIARAKSAEGAYGIPDKPTVDFLPLACTARGFRLCS
jgi:hypothetical protein